MKNSEDKEINKNDFFDYTSDAVIKCKIVQCGYIKKTDLQFINANKQMEVITGIPNELIINRNMTEVFPQMADNIFDWPKIISEAAMTNESKVIEQYFVAFEKYLKLNIFGYENDSFILIITDLTEKKQIKRHILERDRQIRYLENQIKLRANIDNLTNLYNFQFITDSIGNSIESYNEESTNFCVLLVDIDDFSKINKVNGIKLGDDVLKDVAVSISSITRKIDVSGRYGEDKFMIIFNTLDIDIAQIVADRLRQHIQRYSIKINNCPISICGALIEYQGQSLEELLHTLESNLAKAKSMGKGVII